MKTRRVVAFTLMELLVVMAILGLLAVLLTPAVVGALENGRMVNEKSCARNLMIGVYNYAHDHGGEMLPGYRNQPTAGPDGSPLAFPASARYPWRLMPYAGGVDRRIMWADQIGRDSSLTVDSSEAYAVSLSPSLGMNVFYVGGDDSGVSGQGIRPTARNFATFGKFTLTQISEAEAPSRLVVFTSARSMGSRGRTVPGYYMVQAPRVVGSLWSDRAFSSSATPAEHGYVDFRYSGRAVVAHLDGHVALLDDTDLRDMRRWSNLAAIADDPNHRLGN